MNIKAFEIVSTNVHIHLVDLTYKIIGVTAAKSEAESGGLNYT